MAQPLTVRKTLVMNTLEELQSSVAEMGNTVLTTSVAWLLPCSQLCGRRVKENPLVKTILHDIWSSACQQSQRKKTLLQAETMWSICKPPWALTFSLNPALNISPNIRCSRDASLRLRYWKQDPSLGPVITFQEHVLWLLGSQRPNRLEQSSLSCTLCSTHSGSQQQTAPHIWFGRFLL